MNIEHHDAVWIDEDDRVTLTTLVAISGLERAELHALVEFGALTPLDPGAAEWQFERRWVARVRAAGRLRRDFDLEPGGLALALGLLGRIHDLESEVRALRMLLPRQPNR
jgi:hypothetical protein